MKEHLNKTAMTGDRFIEAFLDGLAGEGLKHGNKARRAEYRRGYPHASGAEIQMLLDAGEKVGAVPHNLDLARLILSDSVFVFTPAPDSPYGRDAKRFAAFHHWPVPDKRSYSSVGALVMARTMQRFVAEHPDLAPALMADAIALEKRALDAIAAGGAAQTMPVNGRIPVESRPELIRSAHDNLFTSGTLGRYSKMLHSVLESRINRE